MNKEKFGKGQTALGRKPGPDSNPFDIAGNLVAALSKVGTGMSPAQAHSALFGNKEKE